MSDPKHSEDEQRFMVMGVSLLHRLFVVTYAERPPRTQIISARLATRHERNRHEQKNKAKPSRMSNRDTLQPEYDLSKSVRGMTAKRYAEGTNVLPDDKTVETRVL